MSLRLLHVLRVETQAVVDQILHLLSDHHHGAIALAAINPLGFCRFCAELLTQHSGKT